MTLPKGVVTVWVVVPGVVDWTWAWAGLVNIAPPIAPSSTMNQAGRDRDWKRVESVIA